MKGIAFWTLSAGTLFALSLVYIHSGLSRKNPIFTLWLICGVATQLVAAWGLAAGRPWWFEIFRVFADYLSFGLTVAVLALAAWRSWPHPGNVCGCAVNRALLMGLGGM